MDELGAFSEAAEAAKRPGWPLDPFRIRRALWNGRLWLFGFTIAGVLLGLIWAKGVLGNSYETTAVLKYEGALHLAGYQFATGASLAPAAQSLHSESVLRRIREEGKIDSNLPALAGRIKYTFDRRSETMQIAVQDDTAEGSAEFAHLVTDVFLSYHRERQARRIEDEIDRVTKRIEAAKQEASEARKRYNEFRERHGIANLSREQRSSVDSAATLRADSEFASAEIRALEAQVSSYEQQLESTPRTSVVAGGTSPERQAYNRLRQELAAARASLSPNHPRLQALEMQVAQLKAELRGASGGVIGSNSTYRTLSEELRGAKSQLATLKERQKGISQLADRAQERVESFSGIEGEASALLAEVEVNEALVRRLRGAEAILEDRLENPPSSFSVLDPGVVPELPLRNKKKIVVFGVLSMLGVFFGLLFALWREFRGFRPQTPAEIAFWGHGPVLGSTGWPADAHGLEELVAGLDDLAPDAMGELLFIGGTQGDSAYAMQLSRRMSEDWFFDRPAPREQSAPYATQERGPLRTPPPSGPFPTSGPYPVGGGPSRPSAAPAQPSTALARRPVNLVRRREGLRLDAWDGPFEDQALRRAARLADRVVVLVRSDAMSAVELNGVRRRLGRDSGIGYIVLGLPDSLRNLPDRVGLVGAFWGT